MKPNLPLKQDIERTGDPACDSVWDALSDTREEASNMRARSELMIGITDVAEQFPSQTLAADALGLTQPRLNDLLRGRIGKFSLDALMTIADRAGLVVTLQIKPRNHVGTAVKAARRKREKIAALA